MTRTLRSLFLSLFLALFQSFNPVAAQDAIVFVLDDVGAEDLSRVDAPCINALAARGVTFSNAFANPTCSVTRRAMLFGHWQLRDSGRPCAGPSPYSPTLDDVCLPRLIPQVSVLVGKWHLGGSPSRGDWRLAPLEHGFAHWVCGLPANVNDCGGSSYSDWLRVDDGVSTLSGQYQPKSLVQRELYSWNSIRAPRFFFVALSLAHGPFHRPTDDLLPPGYPPTSNRWQEYDAMIRAADTTIGQMLARVGPEVLVIVMGDNGTPQRVAPNPDRAKTTTFERGIHVPLIIAGGKIASPGRVSDELVHAVDVYRTVVEWCGAKVPHPSVSASLLPSLAEVIPHAYHDFVLCGNAWGAPGGDRCARSLKYKLRQLDDDGDEVPDREEFYDLTADPGEAINRVTDPSFAKEVRTMRDWIADQ